MARRNSYVWLLVSVAGLLSQPALARADEDLDELQERAIKSAAKKVAPSVVQIETSGGTDIISSGARGPGGMIRKGIGPTSGLIVSPDGYIVSSAFNFANKPSSIIIAVAGHKERYVARVVATDQTRMVTLLKIDAKDLPVPTAVPRKEMQIGQTALAVGRTLAANIDQPPSVSEGIISAIHRIWGKAIQTDAKVSPTNYGGPMIDLEGRVQGVLVPASPRAEGETAGVEWYDSGIGFAIPLEDINSVLPRLKLGKDLKKGLLGVSMQGTDQFDHAATIGTVAPGSAADKAGIKAGDTIVAVNGKTVANHAQLMHQLGTRYEGDAVDVKVMRGGKEMAFAKVVLSGVVAAYGQPFLGILPMRDDPDPGLEVRYVYPKSPAETAGLKIGDRIMKVSAGPGPGQPAPAPNVNVKGRDQLLTLFASAPPGLEVKLEVKRKAGGKTEVLTAKLVEVPEGIPAKLPERASAKKALAKPGTPMPKKDDKKEVKKDAKKDDGKKDDDKKDEEKKAETGLLKRSTAAADHTYYIYVPENYDPNIAYSLVIWFHPANKGKEKDLDNFTWNYWSPYCEEQKTIILCPVADNPNSWTPSEAEFIGEAVKAVTDNYTIDRRRIVTHGLGVGGQMALYMGFQNRGLVRGVAAVGAALSANPKEKLTNQPLSFFLAVGARDPLKDAVLETKAKLAEFKYPVYAKEIAEQGHEYLNTEALEELVRWIDSLDRI